MKAKGCIVGFMVLVAVFVGLATAVNSIQNKLNPVYYGKPLVEWADEAVWAEDQGDRQRAVEVLREGCDREDEEARLRVYKQLFLTRRNGEQKNHLPVELVPFLIDAFRKEGNCAGMVAGDLEKCPASETVPRLIASLETESKPKKRCYLIRTLGSFGAGAETAIPSIQKFQQDENRDIREYAREALNSIKSGK